MRHQSVPGPRLRTTLSGPNALSADFPGVSPRAGGTGLTGRHRRTIHTDSASNTEERQPTIYNHVIHVSPHVHARSALAVPFVPAAPSRSRTPQRHLHCRPVRPGPSAWHEMPGNRPARPAALNGPFLAGPRIFRECQGGAGQWHWLSLNRRKKVGKASRGCQSPGNGP